MQVYSRFRCISGLSPKQVASVIFRQFLSSSAFTLTGDATINAAHNNIEILRNKFLFFIFHLPLSKQFQCLQQLQYLPIFNNHIFFSVPPFIQMNFSAHLLALFYK